MAQTRKAAAKDTVSIVLADDHPVVRDGLRRILEANHFGSIVAEASAGDEALALVETHKPDVAIVDLVMGGMNGLELTRMIRKNVPDTLVIILSMHAEENYVQEALKNGASGYVVKDSSAIEIVLAVQTVLEGRVYLSPRVSQRAINAYVDQSKNAVFDSLETLTQREREVMALSVQGLSSRAIGEKLSISPRTVETHRENLMRKLGLSTLPSLISYALKRGILPNV